jgi:prolyl oligopeptidase
MFVTAARNLKLDGRHPTLLTAYGGYGASFPPDYDPDIPMWLDQGGVYAVANIRGGGEYGESWHRAGMLERKQNSFEDFIAAAEFLISQRYTAAEKLAIYGHSNGGLLIGAVITQRPELFAAAVPNAGHYDMLRYHRFTAGAGWVSAGPGYRHYFADNQILLDASAALSWHLYKMGQARFELPTLANDHVVPSHSYKFAATLRQPRGSRPILRAWRPTRVQLCGGKRRSTKERTWAFVLS